MERVATSTAVPNGNGPGKNGFTDGAPGVTAATQLSAAFFNSLQEEICSVIEGAGIALSGSDRTQLLQAVRMAGAAVAAGTADALTATYSPAVAALNDRMRLYVRATTANATPAPTFTPASGTIAAKTIVKGAGQALVAGDIAGAGHWLELVYDQTLDKWVLLNPATGVAVIQSLPEVPTRQTVLSGPVDTSGLPAFLPATAGSLSITSQNISGSAPLIVAAANGFNSTGAVDRIGISASNLTWTALAASATNYLYVDVAANGALTPGSTTLAPTYRPGGADVTTNGQFTFNYAEMIGRVGNGSSAAQAYRVFVGEAVTSASAVTSTVAYALQGRYDSGLFAVSGNTTYAKNHNLGMAAYGLDVTLADDASGTNERMASATYNVQLTSANGWYAGPASRTSVSIVFPGAPIGCAANGVSINSGYARFRVRRAF